MSYEEEVYADCWRELVDYAEEIGGTLIMLDYAKPDGDSKRLAVVGADTWRPEIENLRWLRRHSAAAKFGKKDREGKEIEPAYADWSRVYIGIPAFYDADSKSFRLDDPRAK